MRTLVPIVEGQGEVEAVPVLLRRMLHEMTVFHIGIARPFRVKRNRVVRPGEIERAVKQAISDRRDAGGVMVILDADDDCPAKLGPELLNRCRTAAPTFPVAVILANREFEAWFLGAKRSLRGTRGVRADADCPPNPEEIRGAKEYLSRNMVGSRYLPVDDQPAFADCMDVDLARQHCPSFDKLARDLAGLIARIDTAG